MPLPTGPWLQTHTGRKFYPLAPDITQISREDIAHALGMKCRFQGHTKSFYSVAEHSILVSLLVGVHGPEVALAALLHDAAEAYVPDFPGPLKAHFPEFIGMENKILAVIFEYAGLQWPMAPKTAELVHTADKMMLSTEREHALAERLDWPQAEVVPWAAVPLSGLNPSESRVSFARTWERLDAARAGKPCP